MQALKSSQESSVLRMEETLVRHEMGRSGSVSDSKVVGALPHIAKGKYGVSETEILKAKMQTSMKLRSSTKAPSRPERLDKC